MTEYTRILKCHIAAYGWDSKASQLLANISKVAQIETAIKLVKQHAENKR